MRTCLFCCARNGGFATRNQPPLSRDCREGLGWQRGELGVSWPLWHARPRNVSRRPRRRLTATLSAETGWLGEYSGSWQDRDERVDAYELRRHAVAI